MTLAYRPDAAAFSRVGGQRVLDCLGQTAPTLAFGLEPYGAQYGGVSPERLARELQGKLAALHLKDFGFDHHALERSHRYVRDHLVGPVAARPAE